MFSWGYGVLGVGPRVTHGRSPQQIPSALFGANELSPDSRPVRLAAGMSDFGVITNKGELFTWGRNNNGVLGLGQKTPQMFPLKVSSVVAVVVVAKFFVIVFFFLFIIVISTAQNIYNVSEHSGCSV